MHYYEEIDLLVDKNSGQVTQSLNNGPEHCKQE